MEIIVKECIHRKRLPKDMRKEQNDFDDKQRKSTYDLYTVICLDDEDWDDAKRYNVWQEIDGVEVPGSRAIYPKESVPWLALRFTKIDGEDYGRGYVEEYIGDLISLDGLTRAIVEASAAMAKLLILVKPNGTTNIATISQAPNGAVRAGNAEDVTTVQMEKHPDLQVASNTAQAIEKRMEYAFLLNSAYQRDGERVTSEEIRRMASDLDASQGGIYASLSGDLQLPLVRILLRLMQRTHDIPSLPEGTVKPSIVTGIDALGRGNDVQKLTEFATTASTTMTPQLFLQRINPGEFLARFATGFGIDTDGLIKTDDEVQQDMEQQQAMAQNQQLSDMAKAGVPNAVKGIADHVNQAAAAQSANAPNQAPQPAAQ